MEQGVKKVVQTIVVGVFLLAYGLSHGMHEVELFCADGGNSSFVSSAVSVRTKNSEQEVCIQFLDREKVIKQLLATRYFDQDFIDRTAIVDDLAGKKLSPLSVSAVVKKAVCCFVHSHEKHCRDLVRYALGLKLQAMVAKVLAGNDEAVLDLQQRNILPKTSDRENC